MTEEPPVSPVAAANAIVFMLPEMMTIETAGAVAADLQRLTFQGAPALTLDAGQVGAITTPGLQLLVALHKTITLHDGSLTITNAREPFARALHDAGLATLLGVAA